MYLSRGNPEFHVGFSPHRLWTNVVSEALFSASGGTPRSDSWGPRFQETTRGHKHSNQWAREHVFLEPNSSKASVNMSSFRNPNLAHAQMMTGKARRKLAPCISFIFTAALSNSAGTIFSTLGTNACKCVAADKQLAVSCTFISFILDGTWATRGGTIFSTTGEVSRSVAAAHKLLDKFCEFISVTLDGIWATSTGTISSTAGATSCNVAAAHRLFDTPCALICFALRGTCATNAFTIFEKLGSTSARCTRLHRMLTSVQAFSCPLAMRDWTRLLSRPRRGSVLSAGCKSPICFHLAIEW